MLGERAAAGGCFAVFLTSALARFGVAAEPPVVAPTSDFGLPWYAPMITDPIDLVTSLIPLATLPLPPSCGFPGFAPGGGGTGGATVAALLGGDLLTAVPSVADCERGGGDGRGGGLLLSVALS